MDLTVENSRKIAIRGRRSPAEEAEDHVDCSVEFCRTCSVSLVADCVAVCLCPCAVLDLFALAFVKIPWLVGRRCVRLLKKKGHLVELKRIIRRKRGVEKKGVIERDVSLRREGGEEVEFNIVGVGEGEKESEDFCARVEAERVLMELYEVGRLGFGSFGEGE
ncbi:uncharacterized protein LOC143892112 [Tasmannia lanceolata]|uniref:uncharacterized protein LOC143892112 n=1 Tax=Tasmannia lanceolata TaxID=3420 RepID=UPI004062A719